MTWNAAAVEAAIRALPIRTDDKAPHVREMVERIGIGLWTGQGNARARAQPATRLQTVAELKALCDLCRELTELIEGRLHSPALRLIEESIVKGRKERAGQGERPLRHPLLLADQAAGTFAVARAALLEVESGGDLPQPQSRERKPTARDVTLNCARVFEAVTGRPVTRIYDVGTGKESGDFVDFLGRVFEALGVEARAAGQAKLLMEKSTPKTA